MLSAFSQKELSDGCLIVPAVNSGNEGSNDIDFLFFFFIKKGISKTAKIRM